MDVRGFANSIAWTSSLAGFIRVANFIINQLSLRLIDPANLGRQSFKLDLLYSSVQQLSKDSVGLAALNGSISSQQSINLSFLAIPLNVISLFIARVTFFRSLDGVGDDNDYNAALLLYTVAILVESLVEPLKLQAIRRAEVKRRLLVDSVAFATKSIGTLVLLSKYGQSHSLSSHAAGQLNYSLIQLLAYITDYLSEARVIFPGRLSNESAFHKQSTAALRALTTQALIKLGLTQGDKYIISTHLSDADQGAFALADNYGSIVARVALLPIEENSRVYFSSKVSAQQCASVLRLLLHAYTLLLCVLPAFIPSYAQSVLQVLLPQYSTSSALSILPHYSIYIPFMAYNGILESYLHSTATSVLIDRHSRFLTLLSLLLMPSIYTALAHSSTSLHPIIIVYANIANLGARSVYAYSYASRTLGDADRNASSGLSMKSILPHKLVILACVVAGAVTHYSKLSYSLVAHFAIGGICGVSICVLIVITERARVMSVIKDVKQHRADKSK
ncbi:hypothetical protein E3P99_03317 [Wallemia hederae]|uniref:Man(5)GlcNAc(2)-PP-dolichol translocation protein RFT1 n=1 Tax=Wallemia hederae TaxID=1540922 RepID=A0A4T0FGB7_9BASI|nr:hypothetical protein E3P99_03317 [Wallemia hederae]